MSWKLLFSVFKSNFELFDFDRMHTNHEDPDNSSNYVVLIASSCLDGSGCDFIHEGWMDCVDMGNSILKENLSAAERVRFNHEFRSLLVILD